jgi:hypothetical protein
VNIKEYIKSGTIESCVLGIASEAEYQEFIALCSQHHEILEARIAFELALENQLMKGAISPPTYLKEEVLKYVNISGTNGVKKKEKERPLPVYSMNIWKYIAAACIVLFAGASYWAYSVNNKYQKILKASIETANQPDHSSHAEAVRALNAIVQKPSVKWSLMVEPANESHCMAHVYWDSLSKNTFLLLGNIPKSVSDKQFQLWALLDNRPVNLGIFDVREEGQLIQMKNINNAKAFAITLEPKGGSTTPTITATYAKGEL